MGIKIIWYSDNTDLTLNQPISASQLPSGSFVKGKRSGASGFAVYAGDGGAAGIVTVNQTSGSFSIGEQIQINGVDFSRTLENQTAHNIQDVKGYLAQVLLMLILF